MSKKTLEKIEKLIESKKIEEAQFELSKLGSEFYKNSDYLYSRAKIFFANKLYYLALDTLLIATEFEERDKVYKLISEIYNLLGNKELSNKIANPESRLNAINSLKNEFTGISQKG
jgi:hypothetical protein